MYKINLVFFTSEREYVLSPLCFESASDDGEANDTTCLSFHKIPKEFFGQKSV